MARDDNIRDEHDTVLSPCGWRETNAPDFIRDAERAGEYARAAEVRQSYGMSPFIQQGYDRTIMMTTDAGPGGYVEALARALGDLSLLLRISFNVLNGETAPYDEGAVYVYFVDAEMLPCGDQAELFEGCAQHLSQPQTVHIAVRNKTTDDLYGLIMHEMLHVLALMGHATGGIMSSGEGSDGSTELSESDIEQLWLFSNPSLRMSPTYERDAFNVEDVYALIRYGEWDDPPPQLEDRDCSMTQTNEERRELYIKCVPG